VYAVARDGLFFRVFARTSPRGVPDLAIAACGFLAMVYLTAIGGALADLFVVGAWPFYAIAAFATIRMRRLDPTLPRPHRTIGYPFTVYVFAAVSIAIVASYGFTRPGKTLFSLGLVFAALPVYAIVRARTKAKSAV
jgi:APA family basic amino acid/polyamine antiporter